jgi:hypothetical protein
MSSINLNGLEIEYDFTDADNWDRMQDAVADLEEYDRTHEFDASNPSDAIRHACNGYNQFFDQVFGEGTADKMFHGKSSMKEHKDAFMKVIELANGQIEEANDFSNVLSKYSPERAERNDEQKKYSRNYNRNHRRR